MRALILTLSLLCTAAQASPWPDQWSVEDGLALSFDTSGYEYPTAIAFVPRPGPLPEDPLYFVAEMRGTLKVVTNDRKVHVFARDFFKLESLGRRTIDVFPEPIEGGMAGLCLDPQRGYVFVTHTYHDAKKILRNGITRFATTPETFATTPQGMTRFHDLLADEEIVFDHQIGPCAVIDDRLFVSVGDSFQAQRARQPDSQLGKILRFTVEGAPPDDNPFVTPGAGSARRLVWALGFRNPFGLTAVGPRLFVADNGVAVDRFARVDRGADYFWNNSDWGIGSRAGVAFHPTLGPVQLTWTGALAALPAALREKFFVAASNYERPGIALIDADPDSGESRGPPRLVVRHRGGDKQVCASLATGPDGLYFAPLLPDSSGTTPILRLADATPETPAHPHTLKGDVSPVDLMAEKACFGCHNPFVADPIGPSLEKDALLPRLEKTIGSKDYAMRVAAADALDRPPYSDYREARHAVLAASGRERLQLWVKYRLLDPRFDDPDARMPNLGLTEREADALARHLLEDSLEDTLTGWFQRFLLPLMPSPIRVRHLWLAFGAGGAAAVAFLALSALGLLSARRLGRGRGARKRH